MIALQMREIFSKDYRCEGSVYRSITITPPVRKFMAVTRYRSSIPDGVYRKGARRE